MKRLRILPTLFELAAITLIGMLYFGFFLAAKPPLQPADMTLDALHPNNRVTGIEHERLSGILIPIEIGLNDYQHIPTWNPYLAGGTPLLNNAFNYLFNPFHSLPMLLLGAVQGSKVAILIGLLLAGFNAWALAKAIGVGRVARVTAGALYMMSGGIIAKFHEGHFQLGLSLAWPPLVLAGLWWTLRTADRRAPVLMAVAFALLFFAGNIYYTLHTLICAAFITAIHLFDRTETGWRCQGERLRRVAIGGFFAFGLAALQFAPVWVGRDFVEHRKIAVDAAGQLAEQYELTQAITNYIFPWEDWTVFERDDFRLDAVVDYAYIGPTVFLFIALLAVSRQHLPIRASLTALTLALVMLVWGAAQTPILQFLYQHIPLLSDFRYVGRAHAIAGLWWIMLAAIALDALWRTTGEITNTQFDRPRLLRMLTLVTLMWLYVFGFSVADNSTRFNLVLSNFGLYTWLTERAFTTFQQASEVLWWFMIVAVVVDTLLLVGGHLIRTRSLVLPILATRALRLVLLVLALTAIADVMEVNSRLFRYGPAVNDFRPLYKHISDQAIAAVNEPYSPAAYNGYYAEMRNFDLDEGWTPLTLPNLRPADAPKAIFLPAWAIVSNQYGSAGYEFARDFVAQHTNERIACAPQYTAADPCDLSQVDGANLYRLTEALPYAFVAASDQLLTAADTLSHNTIFPAHVLSHQQDTITIQAVAPHPTSEFYLIVQEAQYPGWQAFVDGLPVEPLAYDNTTAIKLLPGDHLYTLRFQPPGLSAGVLLFVATVVMIGLYLRTTKP